MHQPLSYVDTAANIARNVVIEPFVTIEKNVTIGSGTWIGSNVTIMEGATIGNIDFGGTQVAVMSQFYNARPATIYGGSNEIQRNILSKAVLGLPNA